MVRGLASILLVLFIYSCSETPTEPRIVVEQSLEEISIIPLPQDLDTNQGQFSLNESTVITYFLKDSLSAEADYLKELIEFSSSFSIPVEPALTDSHFIHLVIDKELADFGQEAYSIWMEPHVIAIAGASEIGIMRGIQTIRQIMPIEFHQEGDVDEWKLPCLDIRDYPEYEHRGLLLDVCRHFFEKEVVMQYIDLLAFYKMNVLHFHLTEDQGWRFMSDKYPLLNTVSNSRIEANGDTYSGTYSKTDLKEIVAYASERHITVIPEIEMPGHSQAAIAAYPFLSCTGEKIDVASDWGVFKEIYCAGNDSTFTFLEDILAETMEIFPSEYIHIGGDEAPKIRWEQCEKCQNRMKQENLKDEKELQSYFISRIESYLLKHDRKIIGWDEILEGGLSKTSTVQSWRGFEGGLEAISQGNRVIMSPTSHCYLDYGLESIDLEKIYSFSPIPDGISKIEAELIIGGECNMWTEHVPNKEKLDQMVFPRMIGFAEALWSHPSEKNFEDFYQRLQAHYPTLSAWNIDYGQEFIGTEIHLDSLNANLIELKSRRAEFTSKYRWATASEEEEFKVYKEPIKLDRTGRLEVQTLKNGVPYGEQISQKFAYHIALNKMVVYKSTYNQWYTAGGEKGLTDGKLGSSEFRDGNWQGFWGEDVDLIIDLEEEIIVTKLEANFYHYANAWIMWPQSITASLLDLKHKSLEEQSAQFENHPLDNSKEIGKLTLKFEGSDKTRFIRFRVKNFGYMPEEHEAAGEPAWIFIDEVIVN